jgi:hypothetical protein
MCKDYEGVGIPNLRDLNMSLLGSWISRYQKDDGKLWKQIVDEKYNAGKPNFSIPQQKEAHTSSRVSCGLLMQLS